MNIWENISFAIIGLLTGYFIVCYLTWSIQYENIALSVLLILLFILVAKMKSKKDKKVYIKPILICILIGYFMNTIFIYNDGVHIAYPSEMKMENSNKKDAIIFTFPAYPSLYNQENWSQIIRNSNKYSSLEKRLLSPFILYEYKKIYKKIGKDPSEDLSSDFVEEFKEASPYNMNIYSAFLNHKPVLEEQIIKAIQGGAEKIYIVNMLLDQSDKWFEIQSRVEKVRFYNYDTKILYTAPFGESSELMINYLEQIIDATYERNKVNTGVIFVGKGYNNMQEQYNNSIYQQTIFAKGIKEKMLMNSYKESNIKIAYLHDNKFSIENVLPELLDEGITELLVIPIYIPFNNMESSILIPSKVNKVDIPSSIRVEYITSWNLQNDFIEVINDKIEFVKQKTK